MRDLFLVNLQSGLCKFAEGNFADNASRDPFESVVLKLDNDLEKILDWFVGNNMVANHGKFQFQFQFSYILNSLHTIYSD